MASLSLESIQIIQKKTFLFKDVMSGQKKNLSLIKIQHVVKILKHVVGKMHHNE